MLKKLPNLARINSYEQFYKYLVQGLKQPKDTTLNICSFYLTHENERTLATHLKKISWKNNVRSCSKKWFDGAWAMHWLCYSPSTVLSKAKDGYCWIDETKVFLHKESR